jgi:hypothetical protein
VWVCDLCDKDISRKNIAPSSLWRRTKMSGLLTYLQEILVKVTQGYLYRGEIYNFANLVMKRAKKLCSIYTLNLLKKCLYLWASLYIRNRTPLWKLQIRATYPRKPNTQKIWKTWQGKHTSLLYYIKRYNLHLGLVLKNLFTAMMNSISQRTSVWYYRSLPL